MLDESKLKKKKNNTTSVSVGAGRAHVTGDPSVTWGREVNTRVRRTGVVQGLGASAEVRPLLLSVCLSFFHISHSQTLFLPPVNGFLHL